MIHPSATVHPSAVVDAGARIEAGCTVGPFCVIGAEVELGEGSTVHSHVVLHGPLRLGARTEVHPFAVLGELPQQKARPSGPVAGLVIGDDCVFREHVTVHRGGVRDTVIGSRCLLMAGAHVAHDVLLGDDVVLANSVQLAGHVVVEDFVTMGGLSGVAQRVRVGEGAFVAAGAMVERDVPPLVIVQGDRARVRAVNRVGLQRRGLSAPEIAAIVAEYRHLYVGKRPPRSAEPGMGPLLRKFLEYHRNRRS